MKSHPPAWSVNLLVETRFTDKNRFVKMGLLQDMVFPAVPLAIIGWLEIVLATQWLPGIPPDRDL